MTERFQTILHRYGREVQLRCGGETATVRAFVQMLPSQRTEPMQEETELGAADRRRWLYIGPAGQAVQAGDCVHMDGEDYVVQSAAAVYVGAERSHWWAVLRTAREVLA